MLQTRHRVLHVIDTLWLGGAQQVVKRLFEENKTQTSLHLLVLRATSEMITIDHPNVRVLADCKKWDFFRAYRELRNYIRENQIRTLHCHLPKSQTLGVLIQKKENLSLIFQEQGDIIDRVPYNLPAYLMGKNKIRKSICCSEHVRNMVISRSGIPEEHTGVIYNFNAVQNTLQPGTIDRQGEAGIHIGFAGRITRHKGWKDLLVAFQMIRNRQPGADLRLHIAGTGPEIQSLKRTIHRYGLEGHVKLWGFVKNMESFYSAIDMLCVPSHREPLGMVHLEAMQFGVAVIASNVKGMNELLEDKKNSLLFTPGKPVEIMAAMLELTEKKDLREDLVKNGLETAQTYDYSYFENRLNEEYDHLGV